MIVGEADSVQIVGEADSVQIVGEADSVQIVGEADSVQIVGEADSGRVLCLSVGTRVEVYLHSTADRAWTPVATTGSTLGRTASGKGMLPIGVTAAFFTATRVGQTVLTSYRPPCTAPTSAPPQCHAVDMFRLTVQVR